MPTVRSAESEDVGAISCICSAGWRDTYADLLPPSEIEDAIADFYAPERIRGEIENPEDWCGWLVAEVDGTVIGAGGGGLTAPGVGEVFVLYVDPERQREGAGSDLLSAMTAQQTADGATTQWVSVVPGNRKGIEFYEKHGFEYREERDAYGSENRTSLRYRREL